MQDNELYNYFRERKHTAEEMPQDALWTKIDAGLNAAPTAAKASVTAVKAITIAAIAGITITTAVLVYNNKPSVMQEKPKQTVLPAPATELHEVTVSETVTAEFQDTVNKKKIKKSNRIVSFRKIKDTIKTKPATINFKALHTADSVIKTKPAVLTQQYGTTIKISTKEILSKAAFDTLVAQSLKTYRTQSGKILVIMADGHKPYRKVIGVLKETDLVKIKGLKPVTDTIKPINFSMKSLTDSSNTFFTDSNIIEAYGYSEGKVYYGDQVEVQPQYPDSVKAFYNLIQSGIKTPKELNEETRIYISYIIEKNGSISTVEVKNGVPGVEEQVVKALKKAKKWKPARINGKNVRYKYTLPFVLKPL